MGGAEEFGLVVGGDDPGDGSDFGVRDFTGQERLSELGELGEFVGDVYVSSGGAWGDAAVPIEPMGARFGFPGGPPFASVVGGDPQQPLGGGGSDPRRESGDFVFEPSSGISSRRSASVVSVCSVMEAPGNC